MTSVIQIVYQEANLSMTCWINPYQDQILDLKKDMLISDKMNKLKILLLTENLPKETLKKGLNLTLTLNSIMTIPLVNWLKMIINQIRTTNSKKLNITKLVQVAKVIMLNKIISKRPTLNVGMWNKSKIISLKITKMTVNVEKLTIWLRK